MIRPYDPTYVKFLDWLLRATTVDPFEFADWLRTNFATLAVDLEDGWTQEDVAVWLREQFVSERRLNIYPSHEVQS